MHLFSININKVTAVVKLLNILLYNMSCYSTELFLTAKPRNKKSSFFQARKNNSTVPAVMQQSSVQIKNTSYIIAWDLSLP